MWHVLATRSIQVKITIALFKHAEYKHMWLFRPLVVNGRLYFTQSVQAERQ